MRCFSLDTACMVALEITASDKWLTVQAKFLASAHLWPCCSVFIPILSILIIRHCPLVARGWR